MDEWCRAPVAASAPVQLRIRAICMRPLLLAKAGSRVAVTCFVLFGPRAAAME